MFVPGKVTTGTVGVEVLVAWLLSLKPAANAINMAAKRMANRKMRRLFRGL
jgi:hypothetical protein